MNKARYRLASVLVLAGLGLGSAAAPASAQPLGDANCPGGTYFDPGSRVCVPLGGAGAPDYDSNYAYAPPSFYYPYYPYTFFGVPFEHRRDRDRDRRLRRDDDRFRH